MYTVLLPPGVNPIAVIRYIISIQGTKSRTRLMLMFTYVLSPISFGCSLVLLHINLAHAVPLPNQATTGSSHICKLLFKNPSSLRRCRIRVTDIGAKYTIDRRNYVTSDVAVIMTCVLSNIRNENSNKCNNTLLCAAWRTAQWPTQTVWQVAHHWHIVEPVAAPANLAATRLPYVSPSSPAQEISPIVWNREFVAVRKTPPLTARHVNIRPVLQSVAVFRV